MFVVLDKKRRRRLNAEAGHSKWMKPELPHRHSFRLLPRLVQTGVAEFGGSNPNDLDAREMASCARYELPTAIHNRRLQELGGEPVEHELRVTEEDVAEEAGR